LVTFIIVVHVIISIMLVGMVLVQSGKGTGFADVFGMGGGMGQSLFGAQTGSFLTRMTTVLAILFMVTSLSLTIFMGHSKKSVVDKVGKGGKWEGVIPAKKVEMGLPGKKNGEEKQGERIASDEKTPGSSEEGQ